jgi:hypothetical protein
MKYYKIIANVKTSDWEMEHGKTGHYFRKQEFFIEGNPDIENINYNQAANEIELYCKIKDK